MSQPRRLLPGLAPTPGPSPNIGGGELISPSQSWEGVGGRAIRKRTAIPLKTGKLTQPTDTAAAEIPRRRFLATTAAAALLLAILEALRIIARFLEPQQTEGFGGVFTLGAPEDFPPGSVTHVRAGRFYLVHNGDGLLALYQRCTHLGCLVPWDEDKKLFACPCHAGRYNLEGEVLSGPPPLPLSLFELGLQGGQLTVDTRHIIQRERYEPSQAVKV
ncbi:MAG: ubiquinol-cytochrome c reductase iron-sulfur subunit [Anaerolineae bacterium]